MEPLSFLTQALLRRSEFEIERGHQPSNAFMFVRSGSFYCRFDNGIEFTAVEGDIVAFPITESFYRKVIEPCELYLVYFTINSDHPLSEYFPSGILSFTDKERIENDSQKIISLTYVGDENAISIIDHMINDIYITYLIDSGIQSKSYGNTSHTVQNVISYFLLNLSEKISLKDIASVSEMSINGIIQKFKKETGYSPMDYLIRLRLQKASFLLTHTAESITEISYDVGYDNIFYFSNSFKKAYEISPLHFREITSNDTLHISI